MSDVPTSNLQHLVIIAEKKEKDKFLSLLAERGVHGIETIYGSGSMSPSAIAAAFGFEAEQNKVLLFCLMKSTEAKDFIDTLCKEHNFNKPNTGIAFCIPVEGLAF